MPVYQFQCSCGHQEEEFYHPSETLPVICPVCQKSDLKQVMGMPSNWHPVSAVFTNKGWDRISQQAALSVKNCDDNK
jgi:putative FmdB family regulatory protein